MNQEIRVAICGGGVAGAILLHALLPHLHLDVHIFESAPVFKEAGQAIGITRSALSSLDLIGASAMQCLDRAGAVQQKSFSVTMAEGPDQGKFAYELRVQEPEQTCLTKIVHRAAFLKTLLAKVPEERIHTSKKLERAERQTDDSIIMYLYVCFSPARLECSLTDAKRECTVLTGLSIIAIFLSVRTAFEAS